MVVVAMPVVVVVKVLAWDTAIINMAVVVEVFALPVSYSVDVPSSDVSVDLFMDALAAVVVGVLFEIGIEALTGVSGNAFAVAMTALAFPVLKSL